MQLDGESLALGTTRDRDLCTALCWHLALERPFGRACQLQHGASFCLGGHCEKVLSAFVARCGRVGVGIRADWILSVAGGLRATLGEYRPGAFFRIAACRKF